MAKMRAGVVGLGCRGYVLLETILATDDADIVAVCDVYEDRVQRAKDKVKEISGKTPEGFTDFNEMIEKGGIDAMYIASSWCEHIHMAIDCMEHGIAVAMEVGGACDIDECWKLVRTYEKTKVPFMLMENCCFDRFELLSTALVRSGKLGEVVHCHGAYGHDLRDEVLGGHVNRHYRLENYLYRNCENYPTHEVGPIAKFLNINRGNRLLSLVSVASKSAGLECFSYSDKNPDKSLAGTRFAQGDIVNTIITCAGGETISIKLDTNLPRYYSREFTVRGTKGLCNQEADMIFLEEKVNVHEFFEPSDTIRKYMGNATSEYADYLPDVWKNITDRERELGHGGMDYIMFKQFFRALKEGTEMPVDVYDAAAWMCITALSEQSVAMGGAPQAIPDFTGGKWVTRPHKDVIELPKV